MRFLPEARAELMEGAESPGRAMKKRSSGIETPGVWPVAHDVPVVSCRAEGTKTAKPPFASSYRYGASRVTGLVASVV